MRPSSSPYWMLLFSIAAVLPIFVYVVPSTNDFTENVFGRKSKQSSVAHSVKQQVSTSVRRGDLDPMKVENISLHILRKGNMVACGGDEIEHMRVKQCYNSSKPLFFAPHRDIEIDGKKCGSGKSNEYTVGVPIAMVNDEDEARANGLLPIFDIVKRNGRAKSIVNTLRTYADLYVGIDLVPRICGGQKKFDQNTVYVFFVPLIRLDFPGVAVIDSQELVMIVFREDEQYCFYRQNEPSTSRVVANKQAVIAVNAPAPVEAVFKDLVAPTFAAMCFNKPSPSPSSGEMTQSPSSSVTESPTTSAAQSSSPVSSISSSPVSSASSSPTSTESAPPTTTIPPTTNTPPTTGQTSTTSTSPPTTEQTSTTSTSPPTTSTAPPATSATTKSSPSSTTSPTNTSPTISPRSMSPSPTSSVDSEGTKTPVPTVSMTKVPDSSHSTMPENTVPSESPSHMAKTEELSPTASYSPRPTSSYTPFATPEYDHKNNNETQGSCMQPNVSFNGTCACVCMQHPKTGRNSTNSTL